MKSKNALEKLIERTEDALDRAGKNGDTRALARLIKEQRHNLKCAAMMERK